MRAIYIGMNLYITVCIREEAELAGLIRRIFEEHHGRYGSPRIWVEVCSLGRRVSRKRVERLMKEQGLRARRRKRARTTDSRHQFSCAGNILDRNFHATAPGEKWVSDITYLRTSGGWLYLTAILDLWDHGVQYCSDDFRAALKRLCPSVRQSMSQSERELLGQCLCGEFFKTLKTELNVLERKHSYKGGQDSGI